MKPHEIATLLSFVRACWQDQVVDRPTRMAWSEILAGVTYESAHAVVAQWSRMGLDRPEPGRIYQEALVLDKAKELGDHATQKRLTEWVKPTPEEQERGKKAFQDILADLDRKLGMPK